MQGQLRKRIKGLTYLLIAILCVPYSLADTKSKENKYDDAIKLIDIWLDAQKDYENIPAIMGAIVHDQNVIWSRAVGQKNLEIKSPADLDTMGSICSVSKVFTATAVMKLVDEGKLSLEDKVTELLPEYQLKQAYPESAPITVKSLLTHTSGVPRDTHHGYWGGPDFPFPDKQGVFDSLSTAQTLHPVGASITYSNVGFALLGQIIERTTGETYKQYLEQYVFKPLGMSHSQVELPIDLIGNQHAIGYTAKNRDGNRKKANLFQGRAMQPAMGISSSVSDMAKFAMWQFRQMNATDKELMSSTTLRSMYQSHASNQNGRNERGYGYQVSTDDIGNTWVEHGGMCPGFVSYLKMDVTNKMAYIIMINANRVRALRYVNSLISFIQRANQGQSQSSHRIDLTQYSGFYNTNPWNSEYYVSPWGNDLVLLYFPANSLRHNFYQYRHVGQDTFKLVENGKVGNEQIQFFRDQNGHVVKVRNEGSFHMRME